jgi:hypothetical protein
MPQKVLISFKPSGRVLGASSNSNCFASILPTTLWGCMLSIVRAAIVDAADSLIKSLLRVFITSLSKYKSLKTIPSVLLRVIIDSYRF